MLCISPISIKDPRNKAGVSFMEVPCNRCGSCRYNRRIEWTFRLKEEYQTAHNAYFVTLTISDEHLCYGDYPTLVKTDFQKFMKRLRKQQSQYLTPKHWPIRYYAVGEYGTKTQRPHYHLIVYNVHPITIEHLNQLWQYGHVKVGQVTDASIHYITKYHVNYDKTIEGRAPEFALMSRKPGIGYQYVERAAEWNFNNEYTYVSNNGYKQRMPRYYKTKIWTKEQLALISENQLATMESNYSKEVQQLQIIGIEDPHQYIQQNRIHQANLVFKKAKEGMTF